MKVTVRQHVETEVDVELPIYFYWEDDNEYDSWETRGCIDENLAFTTFTFWRLHRQSNKWDAEKCTLDINSVGDYLKYGRITKEEFLEFRNDFLTYLGALA